jgi:penicillin-binding protein 1C
MAMDVIWKKGTHRRWRITAIVGLLIILVLSWLDRRYPLPLPHDSQPSVIVTARDGTPLRAFASVNGVWRYPVTPEKVSPLYLQALIGYEDRYFWRHPGVNPVALLRAAGQRIQHGHIVSGGSTLSMQVARILEPQPRTAFGKFKQMLRALQLEWHLPKRDILTLYLNYAPFGGTVEGVEAASWAYLGKPSSELSHAEAALLAVLPQSPSRLRRDKVLARLASQGIWSESEVRDALIEPVVSRRLHTPMLSPLLAERLRRANPKRTQIRSTIDANLQQLLEERVSAYFTHLPPRSSAAVLVVDNRTLEARAYVGSLTFGDADSLGHVDMVRATRSPGSTLKPFLYGLAMDDGLIHSESLLIDAPQSFGDYRPANFEPTFNGPVSAADALRLSLNVPAVDLLDRLGPERFAARLAHAGVALKFPAGGKPNLSLILGGTGVSLEQLVGAYVALNREGLAGSVKYTPDRVAGERRLLSPGAAWIIRDILEHHAQDGLREDTFDTGNRSRIAWKTGTSYGFRDAWALGSTAQYTVGVWVGRPDGTPMPGQYGAITALPLMFEVVNSLPRNGSVVADRIPADVRTEKICWPLGLPEDPAHPELCRQQHDAWVLNGSLPPTFAERDAQVWSAGRLDVQVDRISGERLSPHCLRPHDGRDTAIARWPSLAYPWLSQAERRAAAIPALASDCAADALAALENLRIEGPADGSAIARVPNSPLPPQIRLRALGTNEHVRWLVNGELVGESLGSQGFVHAFATPGDQRITALADTGAWAELHLRVLN